MKKIIALFFFVFTLSCSDEQENSVTIENQFVEQVTFQFRGGSHELKSGESKILNDIPIGVYSYKSAVKIPLIYQTMVDLISNDTFQIPIALELEDGSGLDDELKITRGGTHYNIRYGGSVNIADKKYTVVAQVTSNISVPGGITE